MAGVAVDVIVKSTPFCSGRLWTKQSYNKRATILPLLIFVPLEVLMAGQAAITSIICFGTPAESSLGAKSMHKPSKIGFLPEGSPFHQRLLECFTKAGFKDIRIQINRDRSIATFRLQWGTYSRFCGLRQAHRCVLRLLRAAGFRLSPDDLSPIAFRDDGVEAAFCPVRLRVSALTSPIRNAGS